MIKRQFISFMTALAGSCVLIACGGGGDEVTTGGQPAVAATAAPETSVIATVVPSEASISDSSGNLWVIGK